MKTLLLLTTLISSAVAQSILLDGSSDQGFPDIPYNPAKPPTATISLGTAFPDPQTTASTTRTFRVVNTDGLLGNKLIYSATSSNPAFTITDLGSTLGAGSNDEFQITYTPSGESTESGTITFTSNDPSRPSYPFLVSGSGGSFSAEIQNLAGVALYNSGGEANTPFIGTDTYFGEHPKGSGTVSRQYQIVNTGSLPLDFDAMQVTGSAFSFPLGQDTTPGINPGESFLFTVQFSTDEIVDGAQGIISAACLDLPALLSFTVEGDVVGTPEISLFRTGASNPTTSSNFGNLEVGQSSLSSFQIRNTGEIPLEITDFEITGDTADFSLVGLAPGTLQPDESDSFNVTFSPTSGGTRSIDLIIENNSSAPFVTYTFSGNGTLPAQPVITISGYRGSPGEGTIVPFGAGSEPNSHDIRLGETATETILIENTGPVPASIDDFQLSPDFHFLEDLPDGIGAGAMIFRTIEFRPSRIGSYDLELSLQIRELEEPVTASQANRAFVQERIFDELIVRVQEIQEEQIVLYFPPTSRAGDGPFKLVSSSDLINWHTEIDDLTLSPTSPVLRGVSKTSTTRFFRIEEVSN